MEKMFWQGVSMKLGGYMKFFFKDVGTNADIKRHRNKESELRKKKD